MWKRGITEKLVDNICVDLKLININFHISELFGLVVHFNIVKYKFLINRWESNKCITLGVGIGF